MKAINVNSLIDDPLAGCDESMQVAGNMDTMARSIIARLELFHTKEKCEKIRLLITKEALASGINQSEYFINELLFEFRSAKGTSVAFEKAVLNSWVAKVISKHGPDAGLDFFNVVRINREARKR